MQTRHSVRPPSKKPAPPKAFAARDGNGSITFTTRLRGAGPGKAWTFLGTTREVSEWLGSRGRVAVKGTVNGYTFRNFFMPMGDGSHAMMFRKEYQAGAGVASGDNVTITLEHDAEPREVEVPAGLKKIGRASCRERV